MNKNIKTKNLSLTPALTAYVEKRMRKIEKILKDDSSLVCDIELSKSTGHQKGDIFRAEIHIVGAGKNFYASSEKEDLYTAIDDTQDEILRELKASKGKQISLIRRSGARVKGMIKGLWPFGKARQ